MKKVYLGAVFLITAVPFVFFMMKKEPYPINKNPILIVKKPELIVLEKKPESTVIEKQTVSLVTEIKVKPGMLKPIRIKNIAENILTPVGSYMYGYYDKKETIYANGQTRILVGKIPFYNREPTANDFLEVGWMSSEDDRTFNKIGETSAWNLQQGCMMEWINETHIIYNVRDDGFKAVVHSLTGEKTMYPLPVYALSNGKYISVSFARIHSVRRGYGYTVKYSNIEKVPSDDGIWLVDLNTKHAELLFSYKAIREYIINEGMHDEYTNKPHYDRIPTSDKWWWWVNHVMWSKDSKYISFITRATTHIHTHYEFSTIVMADVEARQLWRVPKLLGSHPYFGSFLINCEDEGTWKIIYRTLVEKLKWQPKTNGHCSLSPDEKWILTDTYPIPKKKLLVEELYGDKQYILSEYSPHNEGPIFTRCDLHPRWSFDGKLIFFDSTHGGNRSVYFIDLTKAISNYPIY